MVVTIPVFKEELAENLQIMLISANGTQVFMTRYFINTILSEENQNGVVGLGAVGPNCLYLNNCHRTLLTTILHPIDA